MKKILLFATLLSGVTYGQMTQANEPAIGSSSLMYLCDSNFVNYSSTTGSGVTWDYSGIDGVFGITKSIDVLDATLTAQTDSFPGATYAINVGGALVSYYSSTATERISQGFLYFEPSLDPIYAMFSNNQEVVATYPFGLGSTSSDGFGGYFNWVYNTLPIHEVLTGNSEAALDGEGTLLLPQSTTINNVLRYKLIDTSYTSVPLLGSVELIRTQFEYYDFANSNLPTFIHSSLAVKAPGSSVAFIENNIVLSSVQPTTWVGLSENETLNNVTVSPNPATDRITIQGTESEITYYALIDASGRTMKSGKLAINGDIELSEIKPGHYFLKVSNDKGTTTKNVVIK
jgi:hypothetical protein